MIVAAVFFYYGWNTTGSGAVAGYEVVARFDRVDGISVGTDVKMSGIKIGTVTSQELDQKTYRALVRMSVRNDVKLPEDSSIKVASEGLLGGAYLAVSPGGSDGMMVAGAEFDNDARLDRSRWPLGQSHVLKRRGRRKARAGARLEHAARTRTCDAVSG